MKKICIINHGLASGGTDAFVVNILKNIDRTKFSVDLFLAVDSNSEPQFREAEAMQYLDELSGNIYKIGDLGTASEKIKYIKNIYDAFKKHGPYDVVHSNMDLFNGINLTVAKFAGIKARISHSHTSKSQYEELTNNHFVTEIYRQILRSFITQSSTAKLGCSENSCEYLYGKSPSNSCVIYNGIPLSKFQNNSNVYPCKNIITIGNLINVKNPFFIIEIIESLASIRDDFNFSWVGIGHLEEEINKIISQKGLNNYISMLGRRNDVDTLLANSSVFLMPSFFEGLSIALVEAQASNLTCIVSDRITKEADCGKCEFLPLEKGADYWAKIIDDYLSGRKSKELDPDLLSRFDEKQTIKKLEEIYLS